jgi:hypothetical protein
MDGLGMVSVVTAVVAVVVAALETHPPTHSSTHPLLPPPPTNPLPPTVIHPFTPLHRLHAPLSRLAASFHSGCSFLQYPLFIVVVVVACFLLLLLEFKFNKSIIRSWDH